MKNSNPIVTLTFSFAVEIVKYCEQLNKLGKGVIAHQLLKSGTSIGANTREAQNAESLKDFIHKFKIAAKECSETEYWLEICNSVESYPNSKDLLSKNMEIKKVLTKIISSSKKKLNSGSYASEPLSNYQIEELSN